MSCQCMKNKVPVVVRYSFDTDTPVWLFDSEEEALAFLKKDFENECRIDTEENGRVIGEDMETCINEDEGYAKITHIIDGDHNDVTEWFIGRIANT